MGIGMFKYVYQISPIDFMDGTITVREYMDSLVDEMKAYCDTVLEDGINMFETKGSGSDHIFSRLKKAGRAVEFIRNYFRNHGEEFQATNHASWTIRVFSIPVLLKLLIMARPIYFQIYTFLF